MPFDDLYDATPPGSSANERPTSTNSNELSATVPQFAISPPVVSSTPRVTLPGASTENIRPASNNSVGVSGSRYATPVTSSATRQPWAPVLRRGRPANPQRMVASSSGPSRAVAGPSWPSTSAPANPFEPGSSVSNPSAFGAFALGSSKSMMTATSPEVPQQLSNSSSGPRVSDTASSKPKISAEAAEFVPSSLTSDPDGSGPSETEPSGSTMKATSPEFVPGGSSRVDKGKGKAVESSSDEESAEMEFGDDESPPEIPTGPRNGAPVLPPANGTLVLSYGYFHQPGRRQNFRFVHPNRASNPEAEESHRYHPMTRAELRAIFELKANDDPDFQAEIQKIMSESPEDWLKRILTRASKEKDRFWSIMMQMQEEKEHFLAQIRTLEQLVYELQLRQQLVPQPVEARVLYEYENGNSFPETMMELKADMHKLTRERDEALQEIKKLEKGLKNLETEFTNGADEALRNRNDELFDRNRLLENYDLNTRLLLDGKEEEILDLQRRYTYLNRLTRKELKGAECTYDAVAIVREAVSDGASKDKTWSDIKKLQNHFSELTHGKIERLQKEHKEEKEKLRKEYEDKLCAQSYTACKEKSVLEGQKCGLEKVLNDVQEYFSTIFDDKSCLELENAMLRDDVTNANEKSKNAEAQAAYRKERFEQMSKKNRKLKDEREAAQKENRELKARLGLFKMESNDMREEARSCQRAESRFEVGALVS